MHIIDISANLTDESFNGFYNGTKRHEPDLSSVLQRAFDAGLVRIMVPGTTIQDSNKALQLARQHRQQQQGQQQHSFPLLFSSVGVHPTRTRQDFGINAINLQSKIPVLEQIIQDGIKDGRVVAIGECGLDYDRLEFASKHEQMCGFMPHFDLAFKYNLPMFLHNRNTQGDFLNIMKENIARVPAGGVVHSFDGSIQEMTQLVDLGLYVGINGCSLKTQENLDMAKQIPLSALMVETDCPYCGIRPTHVGSVHVKTKFPEVDKKKYIKGVCVKSRLEPCHCVQVIQVLAGIRNQPEEEIARAAFNNALKLFWPTEYKDMGSSPYDLSLSAFFNSK